MFAVPTAISWFADSCMEQVLHDTAPTQVGRFCPSRVLLGKMYDGVPWPLVYGGHVVGGTRWNCGQTRHLLNSELTVEEYKYG